MIIWCMHDALPPQQVEVDVTLHSPFLVVPEGGQYSASSSCLLIIDLGRLTLFGSTKDPRALIKVCHGTHTSPCVCVCV